MRRGREEDEADPGIGTVRRLFIYGGALGGAFMGASGLALLVGGLVDLIGPGDLVIGEEDTSELDDMRRRFWISAALTLPLFVYAMGEIIPGQPFESLVPGAWSQWLQLLLATPVVIWGGWPFFG